MLQFLSKQGSTHASRFYRSFLIFHFGRATIGNSQLYKAAGQCQIDYAEQHRDDGRENQHRDCLSLCRQAHMVKWVKNAPDLISYDLRIHEDALQHGVGFGIRIVIGRNESKGQDHRNDVFVFQPSADQCHHPAQNAGQRQHEHRQHKWDQQRENNAPWVERCVQEKDDDGGDHDNQLIHQAHGIHAKQSYHQNFAGRYRHSQQQVVVLCQIEGGICIKHASEDTQCHRKQTHNGKIQPAQVHCCQRRAEHIGNLVKNTTEKAENN